MWMEERLPERTGEDQQNSDYTWSINKPINKVNKSAKSNHDQAPFRCLSDKVLVFGGWKPYENLREIEIFDTKQNNMEDILPFAKMYL